MATSKSRKEGGHHSEVVVVSDGTGDTATAVVKAVMLQFQNEWKLRVFGGIRHESDARRAVVQTRDADPEAAFHELLRQALKRLSRV
jgi:regulator of PEP synthase PpsR (kinase-PPPase family)